MTLQLFKINSNNSKYVSTYLVLIVLRTVLYILILILIISL